MELETFAREMKQEIKSLHEKLDTYNGNTVRNTTDISWLKKGTAGTFFTYIGVLLYSKFGGG